MTADPILAVDLGKYKCVSCAYDRRTTAAEFRTITTSRAEVERLIRATGPAVVVVEASTLAGWVHDLCGELGVPCRVAIGRPPRTPGCTTRSSPGPRCTRRTAPGI